MASGLGDHDGEILGTEADRLISLGTRRVEWEWAQGVQVALADPWQLGLRLYLGGRLLHLIPPFLWEQRR